MGLTYARVSGGEGSWGQLRYKIFDVTWDSSYPTGGEVLSPAVVGLQNILGAIAIGGADATAGGIVPMFIPGATPKLMALRTGAGIVTGNVTVVGGGIGEAIGINPDTNAGVLSKAAVTNRTIPIATFLGAAPTVAQGALAEVTAATSLATVVNRIMFIGN